MKKVHSWLEHEARVERRRLDAGEPGIRVDPKTGRPDLRSEEGRLELTRRLTRAQVIREAVFCARTLSREVPSALDPFAVFLEDPHDDLVIEVLEAFGQWKADAVLPALLALYLAYPAPDRVASRALAPPDAADDAERRAWTARFGHPDKRRPRPRVVEALRACLLEITGRSFASPEALAAYVGREAPRIDACRDFGLPARKGPRSCDAPRRASMPRTARDGRS